MMAGMADRPVIREDCKRYDSADDAAWELLENGETKTFQGAAKNIRNVCNGKGKTSYGWGWRWADA